MSIMAAIEEANTCSGGLCASETSFLPIYIFSNVNDGVPTQSCHSSLVDLIESNFNTYLLGFVIPLAETCFVVGFYMLIFLSKLRKLCCKKKKKGD